MGQVPTNFDKKPILIVGNGRVARHFFYYLQNSSIPVIQWSRSSTESLSERLEKSAPDTLLILIQDSAIAPWIDSHPEVQSKTLIHFSGCLSIPQTIGMHPLMTFGPSLYDLPFYEKIPFVCESGKLKFSDIFPTLNNPSHSINPDEKPFYHALCVLSGNFSTILWQKLFREFESRLKIPSSIAQPYLEQMTRNLLAQPNLALTGPLQRRDQVTIEKNLSALEGDAFQDIYQAFREIYS